MSLAPLSLQNSFAMITKARVPDAGKRGRLFETALQRLVDWWIEFFEVIPEGHLRNRTFDEVATDLVKKARERERLAAAKASSRKGKGKGKGKQRAQEDDEVEGTDGDGEVLRSEKSLMKLALMQYGSRDVSAQLFTALCRALGLPARLVVSIQSVPWQTGVGKPKPPTRKKKKDKDAKETKSGTVSAAENLPRERTPETNIKGKGKAVKNSFPGGGQRLSGATDPIPTPATSSPPRVIKLRKSKTTGQTLGSSDIAPIRVLQAPDPLTTPPVFWTEVFSRPDGRWIPVDPIRGHVNKRKAFDPAQKPQTGPGPRFRQENRLVYVVGLEDDGYGRDVTPRYAKEYGAKVAKLQGAERAGSKGRKEWWERVCNMIRRPYRLVDPVSCPLVFNLISSP
jgi:xeroderma pigmentosum group C-complementing protein